MSYSPHDPSALSAISKTCVDTSVPCSSSTVSLDSLNSVGIKTPSISDDGFGILMHASVLDGCKLVSNGDRCVKISSPFCIRQPFISKIVDVIDGDTIVCAMMSPIVCLCCDKLNIKENLEKNIVLIHVRIHGVNAPELKSSNSLERDAGYAVRDFLVQSLTGFDPGKMSRNELKNGIPLGSRPPLEDGKTEIKKIFAEHPVMVKIHPLTQSGESCEDHASFFSSSSTFDAFGRILASVQVFDSEIITHISDHLMRHGMVSVWKKSDGGHVGWSDDHLTKIIAWRDLV